MVVRVDFKPHRSISKQFARSRYQGILTYDTRFLIPFASLRVIFVSNRNRVLDELAKSTYG